MAALVRFAAVLVAIAAVLGPVPADSQTPDLRYELIRDFDVLIEVGGDGSVTVSEEIEVVALGNQIRRGIFRDIPVGGIGPFNLGAAELEILAIQRGDRDEPYRTVEQWDSVRIYIGSEDVFLQPGVYRYRIVYRLKGQVDRFDAFDEIYWNATGNDWTFVIRQARAVVVPPAGATAERVAAYTGYRGETGDDVEIARDDFGRIAFTATRPLYHGEGLTVAVGWPKGFVAPASIGERVYRWLEVHGGVAIAGLTVGLVFVYYLLAWLKVGRDPAPGTVIPVYHPDLPPAAMRFIRRMRFDDGCVSAAIVSLAAKGHLVIEEETPGKPALRRADPDADKQPMSKGEEVLFGALLGVRDRVALHSTAGENVIRSAAERLKQHFESTFNRQYFRRNRGWFAGGVAISIIGWLASGIVAMEQIAALFMAIFPTFFLIAASSAVVPAIGQIRRYRVSREPGELVAAIVAIGIGAFFFVMLGSMSTFFLEELGWLTVACLLGVAALNVIFFFLLKAPTAIGRQALDEIDGTRLYLTVAEADRLKFHNPPEQTPEHFHELLPYAVALDVETAWTNQFTRAIEAARSRGDEERYLRPSWYRGSSRTSSVSDLRSLTGSLSRAVSAATAPRSSGSGGGGRSGSSGGGRSGGGRGGGGGGGW